VTTLAQRLERLGRALAGLHAKQTVPDDPRLEELLRQHFVSGQMCADPVCPVCKQREYHTTLTDDQLRAEVSFARTFDAIALQRFGVPRQGILNRDVLTAVAGERGIL
jgi:hypothetical protein